MPSPGTVICYATVCIPPRLVEIVREFVAEKFHTNPNTRPYPGRSVRGTAYQIIVTHINNGAVMEGEAEETKEALEAIVAGHLDSGNSDEGYLPIEIDVVVLPTSDEWTE